MLLVLNSDMLQFRYAASLAFANVQPIIIEPVHEKTNNLGFRPGLTQTGLYNHRICLEAGNFVFK